MIIVQVPFGKVVRCPSCMIAVAVAQPQQGVQACAYNLDYIVNPSIISAQHILWLLIADQIFREFVKDDSAFSGCILLKVPLSV